MASSPSSDKDAAAQARIISHMNADHFDSLIRYLRHYHGVSPFAARNARMSTITLPSMTISTASPPSPSNSYTIALDPPLSSWAEARARLAEMDREACKGSGCSSITVKSYAPPYGFMAVNFAICAWAYLTFSTRSNFLPGSIYYTFFFKYMPGFAKFCYNVQPFIILLMLVVHFGEALYLARTRLDKHTVPMFSQLWWKWFISDVIEGYTAKVRFDAVVEEERLKKERQKH